MRAGSTTLSNHMMLAPIVIPNKFEVYTEKSKYENSHLNPISTNDMVGTTTSPNSINDTPAKVECKGISTPNHKKTSQY